MMKMVIVMTLTRTWVNQQTVTAIATVIVAVVVARIVRNFKSSNRVNPPLN
jgi:ABC-type proline/glycine betaine transport system permease subunit